MNSTIKNLGIAEDKAWQLFETIQQRGLIIDGKSEHTLNSEIFALAFELFGIKKYWHKRIVRSGKNTLCPYKENPPDLILQSDDIIFFDFGPVFEEWEADIGKTFVIGDDPFKLKLQKDVELAWKEGKDFYFKNKETITSSELYHYTQQLAAKYNWQYGNGHCGHLIGNFPHEKILGDDIINYIHPDNNSLMSTKDKFGNDRFWIYEIHFVDTKKEIGGFFEQFLN